MKRKLLGAVSAGSIVITGVPVMRFEPGKAGGKPYFDPVGVLIVCNVHIGREYWLLISVCCITPANHAFVYLRVTYPSVLKRRPRANRSWHANMSVY